MSRAGEAPPSRRGWVMLLVVALVVATSAAVSQVWTRLRVIEHGYAISRASERHRELVERNRRLRIEVALLKRPERIHRIATEQLGMQPPRADQVRRLRHRSGEPDAPGPAVARARP